MAISLTRSELGKAAIALRAVVPTTRLHTCGKARAAACDADRYRHARGFLAGGEAGLFFAAAFHWLGHCRWHAEKDEQQQDGAKDSALCFTHKDQQ